jgi:hypothetical protein
MILVIGLSSFLRSRFGSAAAVALENLALRHQLMVLQRSVARRRLAPWDRVLWVWLLCLLFIPSALSTLNCRPA